MNKFWRLSGPLEIQSHCHTLQTRPHPGYASVIFPPPLLFKSYSPSNYPTSGWDKGLSLRLSSHQATGELMITSIPFIPATLVVCTQTQLQTLELGHAFGLSTLAADSSVHIHTILVYS